VKKYRLKTDSIINGHRRKGNLPLATLLNFCYNNAMSTLQITLSEPLQRFVKGRVAELGLDHPDQYVEKLLEDEQRRQLDEYYWREVQKGLNSGQPIKVTPGFWDELVAEIEREVYERKRKVAQ
jgi:hypothetical protein